MSPTSHTRQLLTILQDVLGEQVRLKKPPRCVNAFAACTLEVYLALPWAPDADEAALLKRALTRHSMKIHGSVAVPMHQVHDQQLIYAVSLPNSVDVTTLVDIAGELRWLMSWHADRIKWQMMQPKVRPLQQVDPTVSQLLDIVTEQL
jgi:hypothetical protein